MKSYKNVVNQSHFFHNDVYHLVSFDVVELILEPGHCCLLGELKQYLKCPEIDVGKCSAGNSLSHNSISQCSQFVLLSCSRCLISVAADLLILANTIEALALFLKSFKEDVLKISQIAKWNSSFLILCQAPATDKQ